MPDQGTPLHTLISDATTLAQDLAKGRHSDLPRLHERAEVIVRAFDDEHPRQSAVQQAFALIRDFAEGSPEDENIRRRARELPLVSRTTGARARFKSAPARSVDAWTMDMFRATESAIPRETLVDDFVNRYRLERRVVDSIKHSGPWLFQFEAESAQGRITRVAPLTGLGLHPQAFAKHCADYLPHWEADPFLGPVLRDQIDVDGWYALPFGGSPLFDSLLDVRRRFKGEPDYWINGVALPGDGRHDTRAVLTLYRNVGDVFNPEPPSEMRQDMRLLTVLALAWRQLEHQVRALAQVSESDRRDMINLIAPGLLHHEIGYSMRTAYGQTKELFNLLRRLATDNGDPRFNLAARYAHGVGELVLGLYRITDAFNNLDKRAHVEQSDLDQVFSDLKLLLHNRLGHSSTELNWNPPALSVEKVQTDVVLLSQALINIVNNALNAMTDSRSPPPRRILVALAPTESSRIALNIINNGPAIEPREAEKIFRRGYTTRQQGHGQGLYLARLVAHYLGGGLDLIPQRELPEGFRAGFCFSFARRIPAAEGIARAAE